MAANTSSTTTPTPQRQPQAIHSNLSHCSSSPPACQPPSQPQPLPLAPTQTHLSPSPSPSPWPCSTALRSPRRPSPRPDSSLVSSVRRVWSLW
ncbi:hypothetical protein TCAP_05165 [Tolypocladium capitatum]|uniref:Uncharacterized protein n=1 Tax=Tolypocladium capitatum TaxID=45235 RepID=A0A2K3QBH5_9HYPO|nr:hypothetical protein TCAP_05165 [Tolypocladium capitatum]